MKLAEIVAKHGAKMVREYIAELRRQGRIKGKLTVVLKDGKREVRRPFRE
jgi:hypothetical protein